MKNLTDWFDRVYVVNCAHRPDRLVDTKQHFDETGMADNDKVVYYPAIIGGWTTCPGWVGTGPGAVTGWGCKVGGPPPPSRPPGSCNLLSSHQAPTPMATGQLVQQIGIPVGAHGVVSVATSVS